MSPLKIGPAELGFDATEPESTIMPGWKLKSTSVFTYPLIVVPEAAVWTKDSFSSALAREINPPKQTIKKPVKQTDSPSFLIILFRIFSRMLISLQRFAAFQNISSLTFIEAQSPRID